MGSARHGHPRTEPDGPDRGRASTGLAQLGSTGGVAREARPGNVGRPRRAAGCTRADLGLTRRAARTAARHPRGRADVGIPGNRGPGPTSAAAIRPGAELGRPGARCLRAAGSSNPWCACAGAGVGRRPRARPVLGCATGSDHAAGSARRCPPGAARATRARSRPSAGWTSVVGRRPGRGPRTFVGIGRRFTAVPDPDRSFVEPAGTRVERAGAVRIHARRAVFHRLGRAASRAGRATSDRRPVVERACLRFLGRAADGGTRGATRAIMVGPRTGAGRARACFAAVERARA